jgi:hypothetical protein
MELWIPQFRPIKVTALEGSKMEGGSSNTRVSRSSNSNSFPHSGTPQVALNFPCLAPDLISRSTTIQVPHLGQVDAGAKNAVSHNQIIGALPLLPTIRGYAASPRF